MGRRADPAGWRAEREWPGKRRAIRLVIVIAAAIVVGGCNPTASPGLPTPSQAGSGASSGPPGSPAAAATEILAAALAGLEASSTFQSNVTVDDAVATSLTGRTVGTSTSLVATTGGSSVEYVRIPPQAWAREPGAAWLVVDSDQAPQSPLAALSAPITLELGPGGDGTRLLATYPAAALGLQGDPASVEISIDGASVTFRYEQTSNGHHVVSTTTLGPGTDTTPIVAPSAAP